MSIVAFGVGNRAVLRKLAFMFGDATLDSNQQLLAGEDQWLFKIKEDKYYLPSSKRHFLLSFSRSMTTERKMSWRLTRSMDSVHVGILTAQGYNRLGHPRLMISFSIGLISNDVPAGENLMIAWTILNQFVKVTSNYLATYFRTPDQVHSTKKQWWSKLTNYTLDQFCDDLERLGLYEAVRATYYVIKFSVPTSTPSWSCTVHLLRHSLLQWELG